LPRLGAEDEREIRVRYGCHRACLASKTHGFVRCEERQRLDRDEAPQVDIHAAVDDAHAAGTNSLVNPEFSSDDPRKNAVYGLAPAPNALGNASGLH
jgi:hypothetical protein